MPVHYYLMVVFALLLPIPANATLDVFTCEPEWAALVQELGGEHVSVYSATTARQDPHHIQARPSLIAKARRADLLVCTGAELEAGWLPLLLRKAGNKRIQPGQAGHLMAADFVSMLDVPQSVDRSLGDIHTMGNPHIHTDANNILLIAQVVLQRLLHLDADNKQSYQRRYQDFSQGWQVKIQRWSELANSLKGKQVVMHHNYWVYLCRWLGLEKTAELEPVPGVAPSSTHLAKISRQISQNEIAMIMYPDYIDGRAAQWLSNKTGIPVIALPASVDVHNNQTLAQWFDDIIERLLRVAT